MMNLGALTAVFFVSIFLCWVGAELVKRYRPNLDRNYIHILHLIYGVSVVILYFAL